MTTGKKRVFEVGDLIQRLQGKKEWFSKAVFDGIAKKATEGDVAAVDWLVDYGYMTVRRNEEIIIGPAGVREAIEKVREVGSADMTSVIQVVEVASKLGFEEAAQWLKSHPAALVDGVFRGVDEEPERLDAEKGSGDVPMRGDPPDEPIPDVT